VRSIYRSTVALCLFLFGLESINVGENGQNDFTIIVLPDTQNYVAGINGGTPETFTAQTQWIVDNRQALNIVFVTHVGDCVQQGDEFKPTYEQEWIHADAAMRKLELPPEIPYGIAVGNHDQVPIGSAKGNTQFFNEYFGILRFQNKSWYGGHYGRNNDNHYELFSGGGQKFVILHLEYDATADKSVLEWADQVLQTHREQRGIIVSHYILNNDGSFGRQGQLIYDTLKNNPNLFMMLCGHQSEREARREDTFKGRTVHTLMSDYQSRANGGDGWLRIMQFATAKPEVKVRTYSPTLSQFEADSDSQFTIKLDPRRKSEQRDHGGASSGVR
jgi:hypothetical protein